LSIDKRGASTIAVVAILVVAVVAFAGAYMLMSNDGKGNATRMGIGTTLYYDEVPNVGAATISETTDVIGRLVGENESNYFFEYSKGDNRYIVIPIHKETGAVHSASENDGKWTVETTDSGSTVTKAEMTIGELEGYGNIISEISVIEGGIEVIDAKIRSSGHAKVAYSEYEQSEHHEKYEKYDMNLTITMNAPLPVGSFDVKITGQLTITIVGISADGMTIVLTEGHMKMENSAPYASDTEYYTSEYMVSEGTKGAIVNPNSEPVYQGDESIKFAGNDVQAKKYTFRTNIIGFITGGTMYTSMDDKIMYSLKAEGAGLPGGIPSSMVITVDYVEGNL
ncbi:MAG: hypothetical protein LBR42_01585, partial [Candidatus Methanoplasma sp.]|nr:hypothetical protein [Candidatus Methanoplasma sp.]